MSDRTFDCWLHLCRGKKNKNHILVRLFIYFYWFVLVSYQLDLLFLSICTRFERWRGVWKRRNWRLWRAVFRRNGTLYVEFNKYRARQNQKVVQRVWLQVEVATTRGVNKCIRQWLYVRKPKVFSVAAVVTLFKRAIDPEVKQCIYKEIHQKKRKRSTQSVGAAKAPTRSIPSSATLEKLKRSRCQITYKLQKREQREHAKLLLQRQACS